MCVNIYIYICLYRIIDKEIERERHHEVAKHIYIYINVYFVFIIICLIQRELEKSI